MTPDTSIRTAIVAGLTQLTGVLVTEQVVPISVNTPDLFIQIGSQSRDRMAVSKQNYEWLGSITLTLVKVNEKGYISSVELDALDTQVCRFMDNLLVPGFRVGFSRFFNSVSDNIETPSSTLGRKNITYEIWVNRVL